MAIRSIMALAAFLLVGCPSNTKPPVEAIPGRFTNPGRLEAMLSIHAHFIWPGGHFPDGIRVISLHDASEYLAQDADTGNRSAWSRRRRAIAELAAVGLEREDYLAAIRRFGVNPDAIVVALEAKSHPLTVTERETIVADLEPVAGVMGDCASSWKELQVTVSPPKSPTASYSAKITVPTATDVVARALDPQSWDHCSKFYCPPEHTYLGHLDSTGTPVMDPFKPPGSTYPDATLFERFYCPVADCGYATFENILTVSSVLTTSPLRYQATYALKTYLRGTASGFGPGDLDIGIDGGQLWAEPGTAGKGSVVYADKTLWFHNELMTGLFNGGLQLMEKELAGELAELACCAIDNPPPTQCPP